MKISNPHLLAVAAVSILLTTGAKASSAQQAYIGHYDAYAGFTDIDNPALGLNEKGFHTQFGLNARRWLSFGGDFSVATGSEHLTTDLLPASLQAQINAAQQYYISLGALPASYHLSVPTDAATQTFAAGPQLAYRHWSKATLFLRPSLGALRERAVPHPADGFQQVVVQQLAPAGFKRDWTGFYGVGGGTDLVVTPHFGVRAQMDIVWNHPFNDILANGRWTFRYSVGPTFHWGRNLATPGK